MATPNDTTTNHGYQLWAQGQDGWEHRTDFSQLDTEVEIRDTEANRSSYTPQSGALFRATDTGAVYLGNGTGWDELSPPIPQHSALGAVVGAGDSLQAAIDGATSGDRILITDGYDVSNDTPPLTVTTPGLAFQGVKAGEGTANATIHNDTGTDLFSLDTQNERSPGLVFRDLTILQTNGGNAFHVQYSKFNYFENVDVDANGNGTDDAWYFGNATAGYRNNSQVLVECTAEQAGRDGFHFGNLSNQVLLLGCTALDCGRMGVHVDGGYSVAFLGGELLGNQEPGLKAQTANSVTVGWNTYIEGNAQTGAVNNADLAFVDTPNVLVDQTWCNGKTAADGYAVTVRGTSAGSELAHVETNGEYAALAFTNAADTELNRATLHPGSGVTMVVVGDGAARVRDQGVIVGAGINNGGNSDLTGVDLGTVSGQFPNDVAVSDGTTQIAYVPARWDASSGTWTQPGGSGSGAWSSTANDGATLPAQDLTTITPSDGVVYRHNGASAITANGASTTAPGYYAWSATDSEYKTVVAY